MMEWQTQGWCKIPLRNDCHAAWFSNKALIQPSIIASTIAYVRNFWPWALQPRLWCGQHFFISDASMCTFLHVLVSFLLIFFFVATVFLCNMALRWRSLCLILHDLMDIGNPSCSSIRTLALHFLSLWSNALQWKWNAADSIHSDYWKHEFNMTCTSYLIHPVERPVASHFVMHALVTSLPNLKDMLLRVLLGIACGETCCKPFCCMP